tara:strand:+ start:36778 stop:37080 length:303 start_codon:yes stop_codon:yes gene_type:complete
MFTVKELCGTKSTKENFKIFEIDGNFIFENDLNFESVKLTDKFNRTIMVNSFDECEHYVLGGWNSSTNMNIEYFSQYFLLILIVVTVLKRKYLLRFKYEN